MFRGTVKKSKVSINLFISMMKSVKSFWWDGDRYIVCTYYYGGLFLSLVFNFRIFGRVQSRRYRKGKRC